MASEDADENVDRGTGEEAGAPDEAASAAPAAQPLDPKVAAAVAAAEAAGPAGGETVRVDSWIWAVRLIKTRSLGATACRGGHVRVNGERVKPAYSVRVGDEVRLRHEGRERVVIVKRLIRKRVGAPVAAQCYIDNSPPPPPREAVAPVALRDRGAGRPTKRDRRELERLRGLALGTPTGFAGPSPSSGRGGQGGAGGSGPGGTGTGTGTGSRKGTGGPGGRGRSAGRGGPEGRG
ncbi:MULTISPECIES: RNA-binding S4 domain-containing protein [Streptomyces]|uniref:RNA-binding S4 domain-containing protein n=1 Tax=Streptomyces eurythermus TaxID=42237 RepID=A0ABW6YVG3_9ACTN|nr:MULTISPECIES: RNA-binding S4 domain-containing protein [Streptomyces]QIS70518.1 RNA-binding S4 domain-containing protein [Streptomyces sp. DSM 40868]